ncbi:MAG: DMT family transporter [Melioribacteraceae bacterium]
MKSQTKSLLYSLSAVLCWSTVATAFKLTLEGMKFTQLLFYSSLTSSIVLIILAAANSPRELGLLFSKSHLKSNLILGLLNPFVYYMILFKAYSLLPAQEAQPINLIWPLVLSVFSVIFLKQKISISTIIGLMISFFGIIVVSTRGEILTLRFHNLFGVLLAVSSSFIWAGYWILNLIDKRSDSIKLFGAFFFGTIYSGIYLLFFDSFGPFEFKYVMGAVYIGIFEMGITFFLWLKAISLSENKAKTSTIVYLFPVISLFFITLVLGEKLLISSIAGLALILGGILFQRLREIKSGV